VLLPAKADGISAALHAESFFNLLDRVKFISAPRELAAMTSIGSRHDNRGPAS
jgi:hypothetical protein